MQIAHSDSFIERICCFERFLRGQRTLVEIHHRLKSAIDTICLATATASYQPFSQFSDRHLRRLFNQFVGVSPNYFKRMVRHQKAIKALNNDPYQDLAGLSIQLGYCDQSHFIHEFKRFHGMSPVRFLKTRIRKKMIDAHRIQAKSR